METKTANDSAPEDLIAKEERMRVGAIRMEQANLINQVSPSGSISYHTQYDAVTMFHCGALCKGVSYIGKMTENPPVDVLAGRKTIIVEEVMGELIPLLDKIIENGGAFSLEQRAEMLDHIVDSVYVLMGLGINLALPYDVGFGIVHEANMQKLFMAGAPVFREDGKLLKPEGWEEKWNPSKRLWQACYKAYELDMKAYHPLKANNLPDPKGTAEAATAGTTIAEAPAEIARQLQPE